MSKVEFDVQTTNIAFVLKFHIFYSVFYPYNIFLIISYYTILKKLALYYVFSLHSAGELMRVGVTSVVDDRENRVYIRANTYFCASSALCFTESWKAQVSRAWRTRGKLGTRVGVVAAKRGAAWGLQGVDASVCCAVAFAAAPGSPLAKP